MIRSMTGFGQADLTRGDWRCTGELRSVNSRYLDIRLRLPSGLQFMEDQIRKRIKTRCDRGKLDGTFHLMPANDGGGTALGITPELLQAVKAMLQGAGQVLGQTPTIGLGDLLALRDGFGESAGPRRVPEECQALLLETLDGALDALLGMRETEGAAMETVLLGHVADIERMARDVEPLTAELPTRYEARLRDNLAKLAGGKIPNEERILQEITLYAERCDVHEEFARLYAHLEHLRATLAEGGAVGRKIDFLIQELNRETNTLGVKGNDAAISALTVAMKAELEKLREQIQNVE